jgi:hypothetical protein
MVAEQPLPRAAQASKLLGASDAFLVRGIRWVTPAAPAAPLPLPARSRLPATAAACHRHCAPMRLSASI